MLRVVIEGEEYFDIDNRRYRLASGRMMLVPRGRPMTVHATKGTRSASMELHGNEACSSAFPGPVLLPLISHPVGEWLQQAATALHDGAEDARSSAASEALLNLSWRIADLTQACLGKMARVDAVKDITRLDLVGRVEFKLGPISTPIFIARCRYGNSKRSRDFRGSISAARFGTWSALHRRRTTAASGWNRHWKCSARGNRRHSLEKGSDLRVARASHEPLLATMASRLAGPQTGTP